MPADEVEALELDSRHTVTAPPAPQQCRLQQMNVAL
jgi:hypothetical protein